MKTYKSSTATIHALLAHHTRHTPTLQCGAVECTFNALADANADVWELDEAVRSGMDVAMHVVHSVGVLADNGMRLKLGLPLRPKQRRTHK